MNNLSAKFEVSFSTGYKYVKDNAKCRKCRWFVVARGYSITLPEIVSFDRVHESSY